MSAGKIGVYVCQCGGNIGDHVDVDEVVAAIEKAKSLRGDEVAEPAAAEAVTVEVTA